MFDELWSEIQDAPGEIFDVIEYKEEWEKDDKFDVESYINGNTDYWEQCNSKSLTFSSIVHSMMMHSMMIGPAKINSKPKKVCLMHTLAPCGMLTVKKI